MNARAEQPPRDQPDSQDGSAVNEIVELSSSIARTLHDFAEPLDCEWFVFAAAVLGDAPTVSPTDLAFPYSELLERFLAMGPAGLVQRPLASDALFSYDETHPEHKRRLTVALRHLEHRNRRHLLTVRARALAAELKATLTELTTLPTPPVRPSALRASLLKPRP